MTTRIFVAAIFKPRASSLDLIHSGLSLHSNLPGDVMMMLKERAELYNKAFPDFARAVPMVASRRYLYSVWIIGNNYQNKNQYYGEYPPTYLERVMSMFPDKKRMLHVFSGSLDKSVPGDKVDINPDRHPTYVGNAEELSTFVKQKYEIIYADPPYSTEDAEHYGTCLVNRNKVVEECVKVLEPNGFIVWLDQVLPMFRSEELTIVGHIGVIRSTNHRYRVCIIWQKASEAEILAANSRKFTSERTSLDGFIKK